jgi:hypothetical protein
LIGEAEGGIAKDLFGQPEVRDTGPAVGIHQDVPGFQVAMDDAVAMSVFDPRGRLAKNGDLLA